MEAKSGPVAKTGRAEAAALDFTSHCSIDPMTTRNSCTTKILCNYIRSHLCLFVIFMFDEQIACKAIKLSIGKGIWTGDDFSRDPDFKKEEDGSYYAAFFFGFFLGFCGVSGTPQRGDPV